jgi:hypothetical protein
LTTSDLVHNIIFLFLSLLSFTSFMTCWRPTTGRLLPSDSRLFSFTGAPWPSVGPPVHWWEHWCTFFSKGTLCGRLEPLFFHRFHSFSIPFVFHNSDIHPPPFFSLLLTTMPHGRRSVTTSLDCVGTPAVAVLCGSDWPSSACVVQLERKKKKRVSVIVGNRKVPKKSANVGSVSSLIVERLMDGVLSDVEATFLALQIHADTGSLCFESTTPRDAKALAWLMDQGASQADIADQASKTASSYLRPASNDHRSPCSTEQLLFDDHKSPCNERSSPNHPCVHPQSTSNFYQSPSNKPLPSHDHQSPSNHHQSPSNHHKVPSNHHKVPANEPSNDHRSPNKSASNDQQPASNDQQPITDHKSASDDLQPFSNDQEPPSNKLASNDKHPSSNDQEPPSNNHHLYNDHKSASNDKQPSSNDQQPFIDHKSPSNHKQPSSSNDHKSPSNDK